MRWWAVAAGSAAAWVALGVLLTTTLRCPEPAQPAPKALQQPLDRPLNAAASTTARARTAREPRRTGEPAVCRRYQAYVRAAAKFEALRQHHGREPRFQMPPDLLQLHQPEWPCALVEAIGPGTDGTKWVCDLDRWSSAPIHDHNGDNLKHNRRELSCTVLSFGSGASVGFEVELLNRTGCVVHTFDPTLHPALEAQRAALHERNPRFGFHAVGLGTSARQDPKLGPVEALPELVSRTGFGLDGDMDNLIAILKMDVEGAEYDVVAAWANTSRGSMERRLLARVQQLLVEVHYWPPTRIAERVGTMMAQLRRLGFTMFSAERNPLCDTCVEYGFLRRDLSGLARRCAVTA